MNDNSNVFSLRQPGNIDDPLTDILRSGARRLLAQAIVLEAETFLETMKDLKLADGRDRLVHHGHGPERAIQTGIGPVEVSRVKIRNRGAASEGERVRFTSAILPQHCLRGNDWRAARACSDLWSDRPLLDVVKSEPIGSKTTRNRGWKRPTDFAEYFLRVLNDPLKLAHSLTKTRVKRR